jgi:hypothetical protein
LHVFVSLELFLNLQENLQDGSDPWEVLRVDSAFVLKENFVLDRVCHHKKWDSKILDNNLDISNAFNLIIIPFYLEINSQKLLLPSI